MIIILENGIGTRYLGRNKLGPLLYNINKYYSKWIINLGVKAKIITHVEENREKTFVT